MKYSLILLIFFIGCSKPTVELKPALSRPAPVVKDSVVVAPSEPVSITMFSSLLESELPSSVVCLGNNRVLGSNVSADQTFPAQLYSMLTSGGINNATVYNKGLQDGDCSVEYMQSLIESEVNPYLISPGKNIAIVCEISEDVFRNRTQDKIPLIHFKKYCDSLHSSGWQVIITTVPFKNINYVTNGNNVTPSSYDSTEYMDHINSINDSLRVHWNNYGDAIADLAADPRLNDYNPIYFTENHTDLTPEGYRVMAEIILQTMQNN